VLAKIAEIDAAIAKLPGANMHPAPVSVEEYRQRRRLTPGEIGRSGQPINVRDIQHATATFYGFTLSQLHGRIRTASVARARHVSMYLCRKFTNKSLPELGMEYGGRDHTTVIHGVRSIEDHVISDPELRAEVEQLEAVIQAAQAGRESAATPVPFDGAPVEVVAE
jgi:hypothetical protein